MKKELQEALFAKYPDLFRQRHLPATESGLAFGIDCGDGWYSLIDDLSHELNCKYAEKIEYSEIKSKFGVLRVNVDHIGGTTSFSDFLKLIAKYELRSVNMCEICGKEAIRKSVNSWIYTLCEHHMAEVENRFKNEELHINIYSEHLE